ncbi:MAG: lytic transglycosylase domain-containing protein, partial [Rhodospirillales bacterium]
MALALLAVLALGWAGPSLAGDDALPAETMTASLLFDMGAEAGLAPLPQPLSDADARAYSRAFRLQQAGDWAGAERELAAVTDGLLKGHVLARRLLATGIRAGYPELRGWLDDYADHPQAEAVHGLALSRAKGFKGAGALKPPLKGALRGSGIDTSDDGANWESASIRSERGTVAARKVKTRFRILLRKDRDSQALALMTGPEAERLNRLDMDEMRMTLAADHLAAGRLEEAALLAEAVAERFGPELPHAHWIAALAWWRQSDFERSRRHFEKVANATDSSPWMVSAGAFWAARANLKAGRPEVVNHWFEIAASYPRTFYGLLARRWLGYDTRFSWEAQPFTLADADILLRVPGARRALALIQVGETLAAEEEVRKAFPRATKAVRQSMLAMASSGSMPTLAVRLGAMVPGEDGRIQDGAAFPVPDWTPKDGWTIDRALVFAFVRQHGLGLC